MIITLKMVREADRTNFIALLREQATWFDDESPTHLLLMRAAAELDPDPDDGGMAEERRRHP